MKGEGEVCGWEIKVLGGVYQSVCNGLVTCDAISRIPLFYRLFMIWASNELLIRALVFARILLSSG